MRTTNLRSLHFLILITITAASAALGAVSLPDLPLGHDRNRPLPAVVTPPTTSSAERSGTAPSDAVALFDGKDLSQWVALDGQPTRWVVRDSAMECVPGSGYIRTLRCFGDCQLHVEFATPAKVQGSSQGRGNSGLFFGNARYEIQILDSFDNRTYADGSCASIYNQYPPLVNASRKPGEWQSYDVVWTAPRFNAEGSLLSPAYVTLFHNGVLVQNHVELVGDTGWLQRGPYHPHAEKLPIALQDHGNPVRFRNVWARELGPASKPEFYLATSLLDSYCGTYERNRNENLVVTRREGNLILEFSGATFVLYAESPTHFFAKTVDVQTEFDFSGADKVMNVSVGEDEGFPTRKIR